MVKMELKAFLRSSDFLTTLLPTLTNVNHNFLILMTVINKACFKGRLPEVLAAVLEDVRAREAAANNPPALKMDIPQPLAMQLPLRRMKSL